MTTLRLRQLCLVARSKERTVIDLRAAFDLRPVHGSGDLSDHGLPAKGPMFEGGKTLLQTLGVENLVFAVGAQFLEVLFPTRPQSSTVRLMDRRGGDTGYMIILQTDDLAPFKEFAQQEGVRIVHEASYPQYRDIHLHPKDTGGALLSVARHLPETVIDGPWYPAGTAWEQLPQSKRVTGIVAAELQSEDPERLATRWGRLLGRDVRRENDGFAVALDDGVLRFVRAQDGRGEGFSGFDLRVRDPSEILAGATRRNLLRGANWLVCCGMRVSLLS